jgi:methyl-accepting chemotaxis protein
MNQQIPMALQAVLYMGSISITLLVAVLIVQLLRFRRQTERVVRAVEELKAEVDPLVQETRIVVESLKDLSARAQRQWIEVEEIIDTAQNWTQRVNQLVEGIGSVMPPIAAAILNIQTLRKGLRTFVQAFTNRRKQHLRKARES